MNRLSYSSTSVPFVQKLSEITAFFRMRAQSLLRPHGLASLFSDLGEYDAWLQRYTPNSLATAKIFEIGYGACPHRLLALISLGIDAQGVDVDVPILHGRPSEFLALYRANGLERLLKSALRFPLFDVIERRYLARELKARGKALHVIPERFLVQDAASLEIPGESLDLIFSEDVFEHMPTGSLEKLIPKMARWLKPKGLALIRPNIFTGIAGGHLAEWFSHTLQDRTRRRKSEPWEHLRKRRYQANTYLNQVTRAEYRSLFASSFRILEEQVRAPHLGREFFRAEVQADLQGYQEEELFSNQVLFVLQPKTICTERGGAAR